MQSIGLHIRQRSDLCLKEVFLLTHVANIFLVTCMGEVGVFLVLHPALGLRVAQPCLIIEEHAARPARCALQHRNCADWRAGGRWRCVQHWVRRARLSLAMMEQLDMTGRTGELARAFGIDFFSVLTRGSQYRVEAMMCRLAHTQNYLLPAPSKQQVCCFTLLLIGTSCLISGAMVGLRRMESALSASFKQED